LPSLSWSPQPEALASGPDNVLAKDGHHRNGVQQVVAALTGRPLAPHPMTPTRFKDPALGQARALADVLPAWSEALQDMSQKLGTAGDAEMAIERGHVLMRRGRAQGQTSRDLLLAIAVE
jgi:hypothetical protein